MGILIQNTISKFSKTKSETHKRPPKVQKIQIHTEGSLRSKSFIKQTPGEVGFFIKNTILKFSKTKNQTQKDPLKFQKIKNI